ncbi:hypothetical protein EV201_2886 [Ancylomarina subtilis]|uniref:Uncharacterized protein n=1 Tax=Ancylomarina subtilis TaxID=1639035 RepID=A0A4Q7VA23_9BACT|nr:hypothetical protein EV201_2886 [Ancylomarina subtilis]
MKSSIYLFADSKRLHLRRFYIKWDLAIFDDEY